MHSVVFFSIGDSLGGAEQLLMKLAAIRKEEVLVCFFSKQSNSYWVDEGFNVMYCNNNLLQFIKICSRHKYDFIMSSHLMMNALLGVLRTIGLLRCKHLVCRESTTVFGRYGGKKLWIYKMAYFFGYKNIDLLITQTSLMREILVKKLPYLQNRMPIVTIPNLFEFPKNEVNPVVYDFPYIVSAGRLINEKGFDLLIQSFSVIQNIHPNYKLIILGEGPEFENLKILVNRLELSESVIFKGFVDDVYAYFKGADVCVVSSRIEGFPNVLLQMMSQNNCVISTLCAGDIDKIEGISKIKSGSVKELVIALKESIINKIDNSSIFYSYLESRNVESFYNNIYSNLNEQKSFSNK